MTPAPLALPRDGHSSESYVGLETYSIQRHSKSFSLASALLPATARSDARVVYAWCRRADDAVDEPATASPDASRKAVERLEVELNDMEGGAPQTDATLAPFANVIERHGIPLDYPRELVRGMRMDVEGHRYETLSDLLLYCFRAAGTVGLMMCHVLGVRRSAALRYAAHLGIAMQLTNICRDVAEDWERGRLYLPRDMLSAHGAGALPSQLGRPFPASARAACRAVVERLLRLADDYYDSGRSGLRHLDWRSAFAVHTAALVYADIGRQIAKRGHDVLAGRAHVSTLRKLWLVARAAGSALWRIPRRWRVRFAAVPITTLTRFPRDVLPL